MARRYLTKSRFKMALDCPTKLYYTLKPSDIRDGMTAKRDLAALGPLLLSGRCSGWWRGAPLPDLIQDPLDHRGFFNNCKKTHLAATVGADQGIHLIDLLDQPCPGTAGSFGQLRFWSVRVRPSGGISFNLIRSTA